MSFRLLSAIMRGTWLMEPRVAEGYLPVVAKLLKGEELPQRLRKAWNDDDDDEDDDELERSSYAIGMDQAGKQKRFSSFDEAPAGSVAVIPIQGVIMKEDYCYEPGTQTMASWVKDADAHPNISSIILLLDTGGGAVDGTFEFADVLSSTAKPVVAFVDGMCASAGYVIACRAQEIIASHRTAEVGSIGTAMTIRDWTKAYEEYGVKTHNLRATDSKDKNEDYFQVLKGNYQPMIDHILDPTNDIFTESVRTHRKGKLKEATSKQGAGEPLTGQMYLAEAAIENGLIDSIGTFDQAVARAQALATSQSVNSNYSNTNQSTMKIKLMATWAAIASAFGASSVAGADHTEVELSGEQLQEKLEGLNAQIEALTAAKTKAEGDLATANQTIATLTTERDAFKLKAEQYGAQPGAVATSPVKVGGDKVDATADDNQKAIDELPHNKALDGNPLFN